MAGYERQIASAKKTIAKKGQVVTWRIRAQGTTDAGEVAGATKWRPKAVTPATPDDRSVSIAFFPITKEKYESLRAMGVELTTGAQMGLMGAVDFEPSQKDAVLRAGVLMPIETIDVIAPNGDPILYEIVFKSAVVAGG
ncbi:head-to-tail adaptor [Rhodobacter phage RcMotherGoose]|nr:head-to-tail adaptor [Rhodobacter phage RcMotherGoose]